MQIQINTTPVKTNAADLQSAGTGADTSPAAEMPPILNAKAVNVTEADASFIDLNHQVALVTLQSEQARENSVDNLFINAYETVYSVNAEAARKDAEILYALGQEWQRVDELSTAMSNVDEAWTAAETSLEQAKADYQATTDELNAFLDTGYDSANPDSVTEKERLEKAQKDASDSVTQLEDEVSRLKAEFEALDAEMATANANIERFYEQMSDESYRALIDTSSVKLEELAELTMPLFEEDEEYPVESKKPLTEMTTGELIQYLREREAQLLDDIESRRNPMA